MIVSFAYHCHAYVSPRSVGRDDDISGNPEGPACPAAGRAGRRRQGDIIVEKDNTNKKNPQG